jgi:type I restriction enzyme S subunit
MSEVKTKVPSSWVEARLGDLCNIKTGDKDVNEGCVTGEFPFFTCAKEEFRFNTFSFQGEAILIAGNGNFSVKKFNGKFEAYQRTYVLQQFKILYLYLYYYIEHKLLEITKDNRGSTVQYIRVGNLTDYIVPFPSVSEQHRIVAKIDELFAELDKGVENLKLAQQQLNIYRLTLLNDAFNGSLTKNWRDKNIPDIETPKEIKSRIAAVLSSRSKSRAGDSKKECVDRVDDFKDFPVLPDSWFYVRAGDICDFITKGTTPAKHDLYESKGEIPFIKVYNLTKTGALDFTINPTFIKRNTHENFLARSKVYPGDVLMNIVGPPLGKVSIVPPLYDEWNINQAIAIFRTSYIRADLLAMYLSFDKTINFMSSKAKATVGQFNLTLEICRDTPIPLFNMKEQDVLADILSGKLTELDVVEKTIEQSLGFSNALRQSILKKAFSGQLVPQDPNDEPTSELLARIKTEVAKSKPIKKKKVQ